MQSRLRLSLPNRLIVRITEKLYVKHLNQDQPKGVAMSTHTGVGVHTVHSTLKIKHFTIVRYNCSHFINLMTTNVNTLNLQIKGMTSILFLD